MKCNARLHFENDMNKNRYLDGFLVEEMQGIN